MKKRFKRGMAITIAVAVTISGSLIQTVSAAKKQQINLNQRKVTIKVGKSTSLKIKPSSSKRMKKKIIWKSSNTKVAVVSKEGKVTGKKQGSAKITMIGKTNKGKTINETCQVNVVAKTSAAQIPTSVVQTSETPVATKSPEVTREPIFPTTGTAIVSQSYKYKWDDVSLLVEDQLISDYSSLQNVITNLKQMKQKTNSLDGTDLITKLESYSADWFQNNSICLGSVDCLVVRNVNLEKLVREQDEQGKLQLIGYVKLTHEDPSTYITTNMERYTFLTEFSWTEVAGVEKVNFVIVEDKDV